MNGRITTSIVAQIRQNLINSSVYAALVLVMITNATAPIWAAGPGNIRNLSSADLYDLAISGQGAEAVQLLATMAQETGGWGPAPGDTLTYDAGLAHNVRGSVIIVDMPPLECLDAKLAQHTSGCDDNHEIAQNLVRLGQAALVTTNIDGSTTPRLSVDDALSVLIEEAGHSWQEYLHETDGIGGERTHMTSYEDWLYWAPGWEYQVKMYILNLDGTVLQLSSEERAEYLRSICHAAGYANPISHHVAPYGAPTGWPNPEGWPTVDPTPTEHATYCMNA